MASPAPAASCVAQIAADRRVHQAFQWLHLQEQRILQWQAEMVSVPAPPFGERPRAEWLCERFRELGLENPHLDEVGNAIAVHPGTGGSGCKVLLSAHVDTVFPAGTPISAERDGTRLTAPGACDNGAGVAAMLAIAASLKQTGITTECDLVFIGNVGEEGEGDLRGMRHIYRARLGSAGNGGAERGEIAAHIVLDGAGHESAVTHALGSQRHLVTITGTGRAFVDGCRATESDCADEPGDPAILDGEFAGYSANDDERGDHRRRDRGECDSRAGGGAVRSSID